jgi:hypothetical protein
MLHFVKLKGIHRLDAGVYTVRTGVLERVRRRSTSPLRHDLTHAAPYDARPDFRGDIIPSQDDVRSVV